jgi:outer membrane receptor for ferrienterochelin and colicins
MVNAGSPAVFLLSVALSTAASTAQAQPPAVHDAAPSVSGVVVDAADARVAGATVVVQSDSGAFERFTESSADGSFGFPRLPAGRYRLTVMADGFAPASIVFEAAARVSLPYIKLTPAPVVESVTVSSASRQNELRQSLSTRVDVVTRRQLEESGSQTVAEALREVPGVLVRRGSETAGAAGEQIQGIDSRQVLVLLDGQPLTGARGIKRGVINLDRQSTGRLERVEVVKGASSALYGSDAIGGVINLITRVPAKPLEVAGHVSGGNAGTLDARAELGFIRSGTSGLFTAERHQHDGFDLTPTTFDTTGAEFRRYDLLGKAGVQLSPSLSVSGLANGYVNRARGRSNGELGPQEDEIHESTLNTGVTADWLLTPTTTLQARAYYAAFDEDSTGRLAPPASTPLEPGILDERYQKVDASLSWLLGTRQHVQTGVEWTRDEYAGLNRLRHATGESATTGVVWAQHRFAVDDRFTTTVGLRVDRHSRFGTAVSPKVAANARVTDELNLRAAYGRGFRAPDLGQLYYRFLNPTNFYQVIGNPNLDPEYADSVQIGSEYLSKGHRLRFGVNLFYNDVRDMIESQSLGFVATRPQLDAILAAEGLDPSFEPVLGRLLLTYKNLHDAVTRGVELDGEAAVATGLSIGGAYTYLDAIDEETGLALTGRHPHQGHLRFTWGHERVGLRANLRGTFYSSWIPARTTTGGVTTDTVAPGFSVWDAYVSQRVGRGLTAFAAVDNLADNQDPNTGVVTPAGTPAAIYRPEIGRTFRVGVNWNWSR